MKHLTPLMSVCLLATLTTSAMAGGYGKNKRKFKSAKPIDEKTFKTNVEGKTFKCEGYFSDNTGGDEFYQFITVNGEVINNFDTNSYSISPKLIATESRMGGEINVHFRMTKKGELVAFQDSGYTQQYIYCPQDKESTSKPANVEMILDKTVKAVAANKNGEKIVITTALSNSNDTNNYQDYITLYNAQNEEVKTLTAEEFIKLTGIANTFDSLPPSSDLIEYDGDFYLSGGFYGDDGFTYMTIKFASDLSKAEVLISDQQGEMKINKANGIISFYTIDNKLRNGTLVVSYDASGTLIGKKHYDEMRESTGFEGAILNSGDLVISSYCDRDFNEMYGCPERDINYPGVSIVSADGKLKKFMTGYGALEMTKPQVIKSMTDGSFLIGYKTYDDIMTFVKYDSEGNYLNSYGIEAKADENSAIGIMLSSKNENVTISDEGKVYYSQGNRIYSFQL